MCAYSNFKDFKFSRNLNISFFTQSLFRSWSERFGLRRVFLLLGCSCLEYTDASYSFLYDMPSSDKLIVTMDYTRACRSSLELKFIFIISSGILFNLHFSTILIKIFMDYIEFLSGTLH